MDVSQDYQLDRKQLIAAFNRAATSYDQAAVLQHEVGNRLLERLGGIQLHPQYILDLGAGTGRCTFALKKTFKRVQVIAVDIAVNMLRQAQKRQGFFSKILCVNGCAENLPLKTHSIDVVFSNLSLQWTDSLEQVFLEVKRVLKPKGLFLFTTFGIDTLKELRQSWATVDRAVHVNAFYDMHIIGDLLLHHGFKLPVMDMELFTLTYPDVYQLMGELKAIGAHNVTQGRSKCVTGRLKIKAMVAAYEQFRRDGLVPATYEVIYGHAYGAALVEKNTAPTSVKVSFDK